MRALAKLGAIFLVRVGTNNDGTHGPTDTAPNIEDMVIETSTDEVDHMLLIEVGGIIRAPRAEGEKWKLWA